jgi:hypothetical protein
MAKYWLTPPELYKKLDNEFHFDFDPCPYPQTFDSLEIEWGKMNYVNPPFSKPLMPFIHKSIAEQKKGNSSFVVFNSTSAHNTLLESGAHARSLGRVKWLECETKEELKSPGNTSGYFLRGL